MVTKSCRGEIYYKAITIYKTVNSGMFGPKKEKNKSYIYGQNLNMFFKKKNPKQKNPYLFSYFVIDKKTVLSPLIPEGS